MIRFFMRVIHSKYFHDLKMRSYMCTINILDKVLHFKNYLRIISDTNCKKIGHNCRNVRNFVCGLCVCLSVFKCLQDDSCFFSKICIKFWMNKLKNSDTAGILKKVLIQGLRGIKFQKLGSWIFFWKLIIKSFWFLHDGTRQ